MLGFIGRLTAQKGSDLLEQIGEWLARQRLRVVILGSGERRYEEAMEALEKGLPGAGGRAICRCA